MGEGILSYSNQWNHHGGYSSICLGFIRRTKPMLKYEYNYYLNMVFVRQNQGRTISIPTLDAQSQDGFVLKTSLKIQAGRL